MAMKTVGGTPLPKSAFAYTPSDEPSTWKLRIDDAQHVGGAIAALGKGFRGKTVSIPADARAGVVAKVRAAWKRFHPNEADGPAIAAAEKRMAEPDEPDAENGNDVWDPDHDGDNDASPSGDTDRDAGNPKGAADQPDSGDLHVNGYLGQVADGPAKRQAAPSAYIKHLLGNLRERMAQRGMVRSDEFSRMHRAALGHAGGKGRAAARTTAETDTTGVYPIPCPACQAGNDSDCECPGCVSESDCWCCAVLSAGQQHADALAGSPPLEDAPMRYADPLRSSSGEQFRLFVEAASSLRFSDAPNWIPYLPKPAVYQHPRYGELDLTAERIADMVRKFNAGVYQKPIPLDGEHETKVTGAMAWVHELRLNADGSADARVEWTDRGRQMLGGQRYKFVSPEWYDEWTDPVSGKPITNVAIGGALTTRPYFKSNAQAASLRPLVASEQGIYVPDEDTPVPTSGAGQADAPRGQGGTMSTPVQLSEAEIKRFREIESENAQLRTANEAAMTEARQAAEAAKRADERVAALERTAQRKQFAELAREWHGPTEEHVSFMEALSDEQRAFYRKQQDAHAAQIREAGLFREMGQPGGPGEDDPQARLDAVIKARMEKDSSDYKSAARKVMAEQPHLVAEAKRATEVRI